MLAPLARSSVPHHVAPRSGASLASFVALALVSAAACGGSVENETSAPSRTGSSTSDGGAGGGTVETGGSGGTAGAGAQCPVAPGACSGPVTELVEACSALEDHEAIVSAIVAAAVARQVETGALCGDTLTSVPSSVPVGCAYVPAADIFAQGDDTHGWRCLGFTIGHGIRYSYDYKTSALTAHTAGLPNAPPLSGTAFEVSARADLDGDGELSTYAVVAYLQADGSFEAVPYSFQEGE